MVPAGRPWVRSDRRSGPGALLRCRGARAPGSADPAERLRGSYRKVIEGREKRVIYLGILVAVAVVGLLLLWRQQRKARRNVADMGSMKETLERVSLRAPVTSEPSSHPVGHSSPLPPGLTPKGTGAARERRLPPLDRARRDAARRRIEARRAARSRAVG
jgi:hypothetical protein